MLPPNSWSLTKYRRRELSLKCGEPTRHAATSEATHRSPSCCLKVVQVRPVFQHHAVPTFYGPIESFQEHQAVCPTFSFFLFFSKYHRDSLISQRLNFHPHILDFISNPANPILSCLLIGSALWTWEWLPSGWRCLFRLQRSTELWWN